MNPDAGPNAALDLATDLLELVEAARENPWGAEANVVKTWSPDALEVLRQAARLMHLAEEQLRWKQEDESAVRRVLGQQP